MRNIKFLTSYLSRVKWLLVFSVMILTAETISLLAITALQQRLIDNVLWAGNYDLIFEVVILFAIAFLAHAMLFTLAPHFTHKIVTLIQREISDEFISFMHSIPTEKLQKTRTASYVHNISHDISIVSFLGGIQIPTGIKLTITTILLMVIVGWASPVILIFSTLISVVYIMLGVYFSKRIKKAAKNVQTSKSELLVQLEEGVSSTREVIAYNRLNWEEKLYKTFFNRYFSETIKAEKLNNKKIIFSEPFNWGVKLLILGYGGYLVMQGEMTLGMFVIVFQFGSQLVESYQGIYNFSMEVSSNIASVERLRDVMEGDKLNEGTIKLGEPISKIKFSDVTFKYQENEKNVLNNLNLVVSKGSKVAIVGMSGSGKSTISQLLIRNYEPTLGKILVNDKDLFNISRHDWADKVGIVFQEPYLLPDTVLSNLTLGNKNIGLEKVREICKAVQIDDYIMSLPNQYNSIIGDRGINISGGQRQRLAIARTLIRDPEILILDEATSALDYKTEYLIQNAIDQIRHEKTTIIIAHRLSTVKNSDVIFVMDKGKVVESGTHLELINNNLFYRELVDTDVTKETPSFS
ncbi:ABC transporter ATP-binding protein [Bacillus cereus]|uniref:ABC transporter ATP-binding protein n=2 Tax=Bacillus cereus group TaxID=86661 RepID=A0AAW9J3C5_BACTU|nr:MULTISPECIES: ABC transporter ATP-binding protein [Bacillus cereus group]MDN4872981.1 ABC transporter ATP-binding protein [Bacillus cereus]MDZ5475642.1 ABC transporter ATP-binding protein [Bacillus thuringiensis]MRB33243.1 ATP-binding cassette domain-containing protein [Bacillus thuringiensis]